MNGFRRNRIPTSCIPDWAAQYEFEPVVEPKSDDHQGDVGALHGTEVATAANADAPVEQLSAPGL